MYKYNTVVSTCFSVIHRSKQWTISASLVTIYTIRELLCVKFGLLSSLLFDVTLVAYYMHSYPLKYLNQ